MVTSSGTVCYDADFTPFGGERAITNTCPQNNYKFEGKERDTETGNDDFGARYYSNRLGRWLSSDWSAIPVAIPYANLTNPQTLNLYAMVADDPESFADLDGHCPWCIGAAVGAVAGFVGDIAYQKFKNPDKPIDFKEAGAAALGGAITGATAGLMSAPATIVTLTGETTLATGSSTVLGVTGAGAGGVIGGVAERTITTGSLNEAVREPDEMVRDAVTGGATEALGRGGEKVVEKVAGGAVAALEKQLPRARTANRGTKAASRLKKAQTALEKKTTAASAAAQSASEGAKRAVPAEHKEKPDGQL
jgi:RHS repeat-associated protein